MNRCAVLLLACAAPVLALPAPAAVTPGVVDDGLRPFTASYSVSWHGMNAGTSTFTLQRENAGEWTYLSRNEPRGLFRLVGSASATLRSRMSVGEDGVRPLRFTATSNGDAEPRADIRFDWSANRVRGQFEGDSIDMALKPGVQDDLSVQIALIHALALERAPEAIALFDKKGIRDYAYTRIGTETLHTPLGEVETVILRSQRAYSPRSTRFWCAPKYGYVPMRAEQQREGKVEWTMELRSLQREVAPPAAAGSPAPALP